MMRCLSVSIVTAVYNAVDTVRTCLGSIQQQSHPVEHIVVDGGSTDGTLAVLQNEVGKLGHLVSEPDSGIYDAMNKGLSLAGGDIVGILNADDYYADEFVIEKVVGAFSDPAVDVCYGDLEYVDSADVQRVVRRWRSGPYRDAALYHGWMPPHPTFFVRRRFYEMYGRFRLDLGTAADYELMLRFLLVHVLVPTYIPTVLVKMRSGGASNVSLQARWRANRMDRKAWSVNNLRPRPWTLLLKPLRKSGQFIIG